MLLENKNTVIYGAGGRLLAAGLSRARGRGFSSRRVLPDGAWPRQARA